MRLEDARRRVVEEELKSYRDSKRKDLLPALGCVVCSGLLVWMVSRTPEEWAKGDWFKPGGWLYDLFGYAGAVLLARVVFGLALLGSVFWLARAFYGLSAAAARRRRAKIVAEQPRFRQPWEQR